MVTRAEMGSVDATISRVLSILGVREKAEDELNVHRAKVLEGTCRWIIQARELKIWIEGLEDPNISNTFWLIGLPATGKTVLSSVIIDHLQSLGKLCQYNFFASIHQTKRTAAYCLRSIATQLTFVSSEFRDRVLALHEQSGLRFNSQNQAFNVIWENIFEGIIFKMRFPQPLYWILDAVDEADQQALLISHLTKIESLTPIGVSFVSRPIKIPPSPVQIATPITYFLSEHDTRDDIQAFVQRSVQHILPSNKSIQKKVIEQLLNKASGSFLWVRLALETLEGSWHTEDDIHQALTEMPQGMENLYGQMLAKIQAQPARLRTMAKIILTWVTCAWRPLEISELEVALQPEFTGFIQLEKTVVEICGHFVSINGSKVSIIHMTARDFLTKKNKENAPFIRSREGHAHIAKKCIKHLSNDDWRQVFKRFHGPIDSPKRMKRQNKLLLAEQGHPFLGYSTCYWAYHISKSELSSRNLTETLELFLNVYCLLWIEAIALSQNLSYLTRSTQYLKAYVKRMTRITNLDVPESPLSLTRFPEHHAHAIEMWANDFIRVAAKFGSNLLQSPSSIHRLIIPFCPRHSMIGETFGLITERTLVVTGLSNDDWSDCLASVSAGEDLSASKVLAGDTFFLVLVSSCGSVFLWSTDTCEQARVLQHNEYVTLMALDRSQKSLATAGTQTYRIWDISSGDELYRISKTSQALTLAIAFGATASEFFFGLDDCSVTCYDVERMQERWSFRPSNPRALVQNCPRTMALSPDQKKVAMAWRGKPPVIWDLFGDSSQLPEQCRATQSTDAICAPEALHWLPDGNSILILCQNTVIIDWRLYDEEQVEFSHIQPREMAISHDGSLLLTSDNAGNISVWTLPRFTLIYRLVNENEFIRNLAFSPDSQRFYDIRGSTCNVWEPDALVRAFNEDFEDQSSNGESSMAPEAVVRSDVRSQCQITALASDSRDRYFCVGRDDGLVLIQEALTGQKIRKVYGHSSTSAVIALSWSPSGRYMISADDSGRVIAKRLEVKEEGKWGVFPVLDIRNPDTVQQFLFNEDEKLLLISTATADRVWNMKTKKEICCRDWGSGQSRRWITHPTKPSSLVWIDPKEIHTYEWSTLNHSDPSGVLPKDPSTPTRSPCIPQGFTPKDATTQKIVQWIALSDNKEFIIYETPPSTGHTSSRSTSGLHLELLSTNDLRLQHPHSLASDCMADLAGQAKRLLGTY
ncbi:MAG: hypothetical protein Q9225_007305, partial [Loekoesia sp. 1 TL-2023]